MNFSVSRIFTFVALAGLVGACLSEAAVQARFHLPVATHWGKAILAPGDYKVRITDATSSHNQIVIEGGGNTLFQLPLAVDQKDLSSASSLQLVEVDGAYFVKEYRSGTAGKVFSFGVPKQVASQHVKTIEIAN